jgi:hypothetical protein
MTFALWLLAQVPTLPNNPTFALRRIILSGCILIFVFTEALAGDCEHKVASFLSNPIQQHYVDLIKYESTEKDDICWRELKQHLGNLKRLYEYSKQGNKWASMILIKHTSDLDGGELEDAHRALGESLDIKPTILLRELKDKRMTENEFVQIVIMLPLSFVDDKKGSLSALKYRKRKILSVKDSSLKEQKELAINAITSQIKWISKEWP